MGIGCRVCGLLEGAYNTTHQQHFLVKSCASAQKYCVSVSVYAGVGGCSTNMSISVNCKPQEVQKSSAPKTCVRQRPPPTFISVLRYARQRKKPWITVGRCVRRGGGVIISVSYTHLTLPTKA